MANEKVYKSLQSALDAIKSLNPDEQEKLLNQLILKDPELVKLIKGSLFEFKDISKIAKSDFKFIWFEIPKNLWFTALRGASDELMLFIRSCQSDRSFKELLEDLKDLGPQPKSKVIEAQKQIISEISILAQQGKIHLPKKL